jgi:anti-sigma factor RsiW
MESFSRISPEQRANLTAYLDGELDEAEAAEIEKVLSRSSVARNDVELLARTYDLLDNLPRYQVTTAFTERTIASIRLELSRPDISQTVWYQAAERSLRPLLWCMLLFAASAIGYLITQAWVPNEADMLARDFDVIRQLDVYQDVGDAQFLDALNRDQKLLEQIKEQSHAPAAARR